MIVRGASVLAGLYVAATLARNPLGAFLLMPPPGCTDARAVQLFAWLWGTALLIAMAMMMSRPGFNRAGAACVVIAVLGIVVVEGMGAKRQVDPDRHRLTMQRMLLYGRGLALGPSETWKLKESLTIDPNAPAEMKDGWGHPFVYKRLSPSVALLVAPGADGVVSRRLDSAEPPAGDGMFSPFDSDRDIVMAIRQGSAEFIEIPGFSSGRSWCAVRSLLGCLSDG